MFNQCVTMDTKYSIQKSMVTCRNTCPYLMYPLRKISITKLLQILAQNRAELCSHKFIDCLLDTYKVYDNHDDDNSSENSSIEIYRAITKHMSPPPTTEELKQNNFNKKNMKSDLEEAIIFENLYELIQYEEQNVLDLLLVALKISPGMLGNESIKKCKNGEFFLLFSFCFCFV